MTTRTSVDGGSITRRRFLTVLVATPVLANLLAACGDDSLPDSRGSNPSTTGEPSATDPATTEPSSTWHLDHPTDPSAVVVRIDSGVGGFTTAEYSFAQIPTLVVGGDGLLVRPGPQIEIYPQPMLPALEATQLTEAEVQELLALAEAAGLVGAPPDYDAAAPAVTDVGSTIVTVGAAGEEFVHSAFALDIQPETDEARARLSGFVAAAIEFPGAGAAAGAIYTPTSYAVGRMPVNLDDFAGSDIEPIVVDWPDAFGSIGDDCIEVAGAVVHEALATANQLTFFRSTDAAGTVSTVRLLLRPLLPGSTVC